MLEHIREKLNFGLHFGVGPDPSFWALLQVLLEWETIEGHLIADRRERTPLMVSFSNLRTIRLILYVQV